MFSGTKLPRIGTYNVNVVLSSIQASEGTSRVEIAQRTGLTAQTVSVIVRRLVDGGIVHESGSVTSAGGKPRRALHINPTAAYVVGIKDKVTELLCSRPLARKTHTVRVAISEMGGDGAALGAAALVLHGTHAPNTAHLVNVPVYHRGA